METKDYGVKKLMYRVRTRDDGLIEVHVYTANKSMRTYLKRHMANSRHFWECRHNYVDHIWAGKQRLAEIIRDYPAQFEDGRVEFVFR